MIKHYLLFLCLVTTAASCDTLSNLPSANTLPLTEGEAAQGIREALEQGVSHGITFLNKEDGFFGNQAYKLLLPPEAQRIEGTMRQLGMGAMVDKAVLQINRAAEDAVGTARPIFADAIKELTIADALTIVRGADSAATQYFRQKTTDKLIAAFMPVIKGSLEKFSATKYYGDVINTYNGFPTTLRKVNPDLPSYVTGRAVDALFDQIGKEEAAIRANPAARTTEILKRVFGRRTGTF
jgi:ABC-type transporter MlaC component